jgi:hypothetical protein
MLGFTLTTYALIGINILERTMQELRDNLDVTLPILGSRHFSLPKSPLRNASSEMQELPERKKRLFP